MSGVVKVDWEDECLAENEVYRGEYASRTMRNGRWKGSSSIPRWMVMKGDGICRAVTSA